jgi:hypothetical protein
MFSGSSRRPQRRRDGARVLLGAIRFVNGTLGLFAPGFLAKRLGVEPPASEPTYYPFRLFGVRTAILGAQLWTAPPDELRRALRLAIVIHASDTAAALTAAARGELPRDKALTTAALSAFNTTLAVLAQR